MPGTILAPSAVFLAKLSARGYKASLIKNITANIKYLSIALLQNCFAKKNPIHTVLSPHCSSHGFTISTSILPHGTAVFKTMRMCLENFDKHWIKMFSGVFDYDFDG